jgi:hypothetical protein
MTIQYQRVEEVEDSIKAIAPSILYKFRDWGNSDHQKILTEQELWLAHPKTLNDLHDVTVPLKFKPEEVDDPSFQKKLRQALQSMHPHIPPGSRDFETICENQTELIKADPDHFQKNYRVIRDGNDFDIIGIFCLGESSTDVLMWGYYGNGKNSFCVGFDTIGLVKKLYCTFSKVRYTPNVITWSFLADEEQLNDTLYTKHTDWQHEKEWRFVTPLIDSDKDRSVRFDKSLIKEVILGPKIDKQSQEHIIKTLKIEYNSVVKLYKIVPNEGDYGYKKIEMDY